MKKRILLFVLCSLTFILTLEACEPRDALSFTSSKTYTVNDFDPAQNLDGEEALLKLLGLSANDLDMWRDHISPNNGSRARKFHQVVKGRRLYGASLLLVTDKDGQFVRLSVRSPGNIDDFKIIEASLSEEEAIPAAIRGVYGWRIKESSFVIKPKTKRVIYHSAPLYRLIFDGHKKNSKRLRQAYIVSLNGSPNGKAVPDAIRGDVLEVLVDGKTGKIVDVIDLVIEG